MTSELFDRNRPFEVRTRLDGGGEMLAGYLYWSRSGSVFRYDQSWLHANGAYPLFPSMLLSLAPYPFRGIGPFTDSAPDRWGRMLLDRSAGGRTLSEIDYLAGVTDLTRQGAVRFFQDGHPLAGKNGVPMLEDLPGLMDTADEINAGRHVDERDVRRLFAASGSLGGARPKASVTDQGKLFMAKFPRAQGDEWEIIGWEAATLILAQKAGITVPAHRFLRAKNPRGQMRTILLTQRFDRQGGRVDGVRIPYMSAITALGGSDGDIGEWMDLADFLRSQGSEADLPELWKRAVFDTAIGDLDDHLRNHAFLRKDGRWRLSPAFDLNPTPLAKGNSFETALFGHTELTVADFVTDDALELFNIDLDKARQYLSQCAAALGTARQAAHRVGINAGDISLMLGRFDKGCAECEQASQKLSRRLADVKKASKPVPRN